MFNFPGETSLLVHRVLFGPLTGGLECSPLVFLPVLGHVVGKWVVRVGRREKGLDRQEDSADLKSRDPLVWVQKEKEKKRRKRKK